MSGRKMRLEISRPMLVVDIDCDTADQEMLAALLAQEFPRARQTSGGKGTSFSIVIHQDQFDILRRKIEEFAAEHQIEVQHPVPR